ncbi:D-alanyl-D-alanine carboxypeptidase/D-alanyl-D-alanine-endopeptidase [Saccharothrix sp. ALI-22-I]|uniref:D-alanyl-D-alanine carboxypeptidase/D-alanyl-D-alanine endopeptidase n=1 Tax=Saccharothrix sp. ALI-22-I TaxID=1933778 RepID=UPI00097C2449|nr:D-alanyl-D-alanine carboxypeptidase/D-alanyl-D-alanine-endopeptidase [Saccharothrix sp. ALI-22-I]ONI81849.1 D-alanyl-D-alanine carboxypeptidase/D-alanyl-D-alanine-endopeptidase [Saccharothrix sp. ALI-22-I]
MPDEPSWPTVDGDEVDREPPTVQVRRPEPPTMRMQAPVPAKPVRVPPKPVAPPPPPRPEPATEIKSEPEPVAEPITESEEPPPPRARRRKRPFVLGAAALLVVALAGTAVTGAQMGWFDTTPAPTTAAPLPPAPVALSMKGVGADGAAPTAAGVRAMLTGPAANGLLNPIAGLVVDPVTGTALWNQGETTPQTPASTIKILTAAAALLALDHTSQLSTQVVQGAQPGTVVLVGGGDPTLSSLPAGESTVYPGAATIDDLAAQVRAAGPVTQVQYDVSRYAGATMAPGWDPADVQNGYVAPIEPVMLDGGRNDPKAYDTPRASAPAAEAARVLAQRLGVPAVAAGVAAPGAKVLGEVKSAPVDQLVENLMQISDNVLAETMAREVAKARGAELSFAGAAKAVRDVLTENGFDLSSATIVDGSGLSPNDKVPAKLLADVLAAAAKPDASDPKTAKLRPLLTALPVAGGSGTLAGRYEEFGAEGRGWVRAKTGTLTSVNSLAGVVLTTDGRLLVFTFMSLNPGRAADVRGALDEMAAALRTCGC